MPNSTLDIFNMALLRVGSTRIGSTAERSQNADLCNTFWENVRDEVLVDYEWNCSVKRASLVRLSETPVSGWDYAFALPSDCLRVLATADGSDFVIESGKLLCDYTSISIKYIHRIQDVSVMPPHVQKVMWMSLAAAIAFAKTQSTTRAEIVNELYTIVLPTARTIDSQEGSRGMFANETYTDPFTQYGGG